MLADRAADRDRDVDHYRAYDAREPADARLDVRMVDMDALWNVCFPAMAPPQVDVRDVRSGFVFGGTFSFSVPRDGTPRTIHLVSTPDGRLVQVNRSRNLKKRCEYAA